MQPGHEYLLSHWMIAISIHPIDACFATIAGQEMAIRAEASVKKGIGYIVDSHGFIRRIWAAAFFSPLLCFLVVAINLLTIEEVTASSEPLVSLPLVVIRAVSPCANLLQVFD